MPAGCDREINIENRFCGFGEIKVDMVYFGMSVLNVAITNTQNHDINYLVLFYFRHQFCNIL